MCSGGTVFDGVACEYGGGIGDACGGVCVEPQIKFAQAREGCAGLRFFSP